jgi:xeroderma pigmentosum group C-complementing protein
VLERHLKQTETIFPPPPFTVELGKFRGEPVYSRSAIVSLKTAENWLRSSGRVVKEAEQPLKMVKVRPNTINKMRELEVLRDELKVAGSDSPNGEGSSSAVAGEVMQGLYAFSQTETYVPEPVIDVSIGRPVVRWCSVVSCQGVIPRNSFGNIDLYVPSMLPRGAAHVPCTFCFYCWHFIL